MRIFQGLCLGAFINPGTLALFEDSTDDSTDATTATVKTTTVKTTTVKTTAYTTTAYATTEAPATTTTLPPYVRESGAGQRRLAELENTPKPLTDDEKRDLERTETQAKQDAAMVGSPTWVRGAWMYGNFGNDVQVDSPTACAALCQEYFEECTHWNFFLASKNCGLLRNSVEMPGYLEEVYSSVSGTGPASALRTDEELNVHIAIGDARRKAAGKGAEL